MQRFLVTGIVLFYLFAVNAASGADPLPVFPRNPSLWLNSSPVSTEMLKGKAIMIYFFEEGCPRCRAKWPKIMNISKKLNGEPVLIIAVNSGTPRNRILSYVRRSRINLPIIIDEDRSFETACGVNKISLKNIWQLRIITADGKLTSGKVSQLEVEAREASESASWNIDPKEIPDILNKAWVRVEFGDYSGAAKMIKKNQKSRDMEIKTAAEKLLEYVNDQVNEDLKSANSDLEMENKWNAFKKYTNILKRFKGYEVPEEVGQKIKTLKTDEIIKDELYAQKRFSLAERTYNSRSKSGRKKAMSILRKLVSEHPETEAGQKAEEAIEKIEGSSFVK
jgi:thiol-disulfide isomerase/thioredoxin